MGSNLDFWWNWRLTWTYLWGGATQRVEWTTSWSPLPENRNLLISQCLKGNGMAQRLLPRFSTWRPGFESGKSGQLTRMRCFWRWRSGRTSDSDFFGEPSFRTSASCPAEGRPSRRGRSDPSTSRLAADRRPPEPEIIQWVVTAGRINRVTRRQIPGAWSATAYHR